MSACVVELWASCWPLPCRQAKAAMPVHHVCVLQSHAEELVHSHIGYETPSTNAQVLCLSPAELVVCYPCCTPLRKAPGTCTGWHMRSHC